MVAKLTKLSHKIEIPLHVVAENHIICSSYSRQPVQKLLDTPSYKVPSVSKLLSENKEKTDFLQQRRCV